MSLRDLLPRLEAFAAGQLEREALRRWFTPYIAARVPPPELDDEGADLVPPAWSPARDEEALFWQLVWRFEDGSLSEHEHRELARRVLACYEQTGRPDFTTDLLPLLTRGPRLCGIVAKRRRGIVSAVGLASVIRKAFWAEGDLFLWLAAASLENLEALCARLQRNEYVAIQFLLERPPA